MRIVIESMTLKEMKDLADIGCEGTIEKKNGVTLSF
jgi:hypothetical protein